MTYICPNGIANIEFTDGDDIDDLIRYIDCTFSFTATAYGDAEGEIDDYNVDFFRAYCTEHDVDDIENTYHPDWTNIFETNLGCHVCTECDHTTGTLWHTEEAYTEHLDDAHDDDDEDEIFTHPTPTYGASTSHSNWQHA